MTTTRTLTVIAGFVAGLALLAGCTGTTTPTPTTTPTTSTSPTATAGPVAPPSSEDEAIAAATEVAEESLVIRGEVSAAGGDGIERFDAVLTGQALQSATDEIDLYNAQGYVTTGAVTADFTSAYTQTYEGVEFGMVTLPSCTDFSTLIITTSDGSPAPRPSTLQYPVDYQVVYVAEDEAWKVSNMIKTGDTC